MVVGCGCSVSKPERSRLLAAPNSVLCCSGSLRARTAAPRVVLRGQRIRRFSRRGTHSLFGISYQDPVCTVRIFLAVLLAALFIGGCSLSTSADRFETSSPAFRTDAQTYRAGSEVGLRLTNRTGEPVYHALCASTLQRKSGNTWTAVPHEVNAACPSIRFRLAPTETAALPLRVPASTATGLYRFLARVDLEGQNTTRIYVTSTFLVNGDAPAQPDLDPAIVQAETATPGR